MAADFNVSVVADDVVQVLEKWRAKGNHLAPTMAIVGDQLVAEVNDMFETAGHGDWPGHADSTIAKYGEHELLKLTGVLAGSIAADSGEDFAEASTGVAYAVYHVSDEPRTIIPLRNFFDVPEEAFDRAAQTILEALSVVP